ncbi:uncharacterized protein ACA1_394400 [Acanthamoeba castellanii str. Neff]|uniref:Uncharacterized protein n=1 Tax=Acanthamoeba castellanii (strain ATCC 30010 / Neff) TaxID=1257118 RepID=L8GZM1_ACACF|nr:uncharacterized protein ACA1_394400 [Acanthamoeba castellanii str. Neff]ELR18684.1 hypothetical protein ACA1_394400 [Acanthamoeba castellanii str. Neff]
MNLAKACLAKPGSKAASLFKYVDSPQAHVAAKKKAKKKEFKEQDGKRDSKWDGERDGEQDSEQDGEWDGKWDGEQDGERDGEQDKNEDDNDSNKDDDNDINNKYNNDNSDNGNGNGEEASQPDTHPEDVALPPARVARGNTSSLVVMKNSCGVKRTGPSTYDVVPKKTCTKSASSGSREDLEDQESSLCSQLAAWLASPEGSPLLRKRKRDSLVDAETTTRPQPPADAVLCTKKQRTTSASTQERSTQGDDQAASAAKQLTRLANTQPGAQQPRQDPDEPTEAEIDSVCEHSAPRKSGRKRVLTERALEHAQQSPAPARVNDDLKVVDGDKLRQRISNLPAWAVPPPAALEAAIRSVTGADDLEWDPMANGTIALKFDTEQVWMARRNIKIYIAYRPSTPTPQYMRIH